MVKLAVCDDDALVLRDVGGLVEQYRAQQNNKIEYMTFQSPLELITMVEKGSCFDIIFLDVVMPGLNGIEAAREIRQYDKNVKIIFLTSSTEFAVQSYTVGAYFYQLKPIWPESFFRLMEEALLDYAREREDSLVLKCKTGITRIPIGQLEYCEVVGKKLFFHLSSGKVFESGGSMGEISDRMVSHGGFLRPHRSYLVNMEYIQNISHRAITMISQTVIPLPQGKYTETKDIFLDFLFEKEQRSDGCPKTV